MLENELAFYCDVNLLDNFPSLQINKWDCPSVINNAIIEFDIIEFESLKYIFNELTTIYLTRYIEIHITTPIQYSQLEVIIDFLNSLDLYSYNLILSLENKHDLDAVIHTIKINHKIYDTIIYFTDQNCILTSEKGDWGNIHLMNDKFTYNTCGIIENNYFNYNLSHISESMSKHNTCLNRKLTIDAKGDIKNCPSMIESYGNINNTTISEVIKQQGFKNKWYIHKDEVKICKDCEFRHVCTDCRAYLDNPEDIYSKPLKCGYDPYKCEWQEWSSNPLKYKALAFYGI